MRAVLLIPRRGQQEDYDRAWSLASAYYATSGYEMFVADSPGERFCLPAARNAASRLAGDWDVAAFINADCLVPIASLKRGFAHAVESGRLTIPWDRYYSMTQAGHEAGADLAVPIDDPDLEARWCAGSWGPEVFPAPFYAPGGDVIVPRVVWDRLGSAWDERFLGVQPEDAAMLIAAGSFDRLSGPAYHFWHPSGGAPYVEADGAWPEYRARYVSLLESGAFVQRLVDEGREIHDFGGWGW